MPAIDSGSTRSTREWVNSIHPGTTETEMGDQVLVMRARSLGANDIDEALRQALPQLPIGRMGTVIDIANGIVFLASDDAGFMTGGRPRPRRRHHRAVTDAGSGIAVIACSVPVRKVEVSISQNV